MRGFIGSSIFIVTFSVCVFLGGPGALVSTPVRGFMGTSIVIVTFAVCVFGVCAGGGCQVPGWGWWWLSLELILLVSAFFVGDGASSVSPVGFVLAVEH